MAPPLSDANAASHPYYPLSLSLSGNVYLPNSLPVLALVQSFGGVVAALLLSTLLIARRVRPDLGFTDQTLVLWFVMTGCIHIFFEGYFVLHHDHIAGAGDVLAQLWKEYALSDSRYLSSDPLVLCMETCTVLTWGPLSLLTAFLILRSSPYRHPIQAFVSTGHVYGCTLYLLTTFFEGRAYWRPEAMYFWVYFIGMNAVWLVIPGYCLCSSIKASARAFVALESSADVKGKKDL